MGKQAFFRFEASPLIGAGHAIRSCVLADALVENGWKCNIVTTEKSYDFINDLNRFNRVEPEDFYQNPLFCDLLVIDNYDLDLKYEKHFRSFAKKIMIIDDLANRQHDCDVLLDQTYGRDPNDYKNLVPENCTILAGSDYVLLRKEFILMRPKAIEKRRNTKEIKRILISMGGSCQNNHILKALEMVKASGFAGNIDVVLGFDKNNLDQIKQYVKSMINKVDFHVNANMAELIYEADLAIGAAGSSVWERCCLGLPSVLFLIASNQKYVYELLIHNKICYSFEDFVKNDLYKFSFNKKFYNLLDGFGSNRVLIEALMHSTFTISLKKLSPEDKDMLFGWQNIKGMRKYCNNPKIPSYEEHLLWFKQRIKQAYNPFWIIYDCDNNPIGAINLVYNYLNDYYDLGWYIIPDRQSKGFGTQALKIVTSLVRPIKLHAFVKSENVLSQKALQKASFAMVDSQNYLFNN